MPTGSRLALDQTGILSDAFHLKPAAAINHLRQKGYALTWNWHEMWQQAHQRAFTVAKIAKMDILQDIRSMIDKATDEGWSYQRFARELEPQLQAKGWWGKKEIINEETGEVTEVQQGSPHRLKTIYDTNLRTQYAVGKWDGQWNNRQNRPYIQFLAIIDRRTTDQCRSIHAMVFRIDDPMVDKFYPPNHFRCRLNVRSLSQAEVDRRGLRVESSDGRIQEKTVRVGDQDVTITGFDTGRTGSDGKPLVYWTEPGWNYNPGKIEFKPDLSKYDPDIKKQFNKPVKRRKTKPTETPVPETTPFIPDNFKTQIGTEIFPVSFWNKMRATVPLRLSRMGTRSYYSYTYSPNDPGHVVIGKKRHKTIDSRAFVAAHEYGHAFFRNHVMKDVKLTQKFNSLFNVAIDEIKSIPVSEKRKLNNFFAHLKEVENRFPQIDREIVKELYLAVSDTFAAVTHNEYGTGHSKSYFSSLYKRQTELFAHTSETYFRGNPVMDRLLPKTATAMRSLMKEILK